MRQIFENKIPAVGDYALVRGMRGARVVTGVFIYLNEGAFLFNSDPGMNGSRPDDCSLFAAFNYHNSWQLDTRCSEDTIIDILDRALSSVIILNERVVVGKRKIDFNSNKYENNSVYSGYHGYHSHRYDTLNKPKKDSPYLFGVEMEVEFYDGDERRDFTDKTSNWFYCERDGSLGEYGCEIITIPLRPSDAKDVEFWKPLTSYLDRRSTTNDRCGLHIHVSRSILGVGDVFNYNLGKLLYAYHHHWTDTKFNIKIAGRTRGYHACDGKTDEGDAAKLLGARVFATPSVRDKISDAMRGKSSAERYYDINITNSRTIEFRKGAGTIDPERVTMLVEYFELLCKYACQAKWQNISENDIHAFLIKRAKNQTLIQILQQ